MLTIALGLLKQFWKPLLLGFIIIVAAWQIKAWDNARLKAQYDKGYKVAFIDQENEAQRLIRESDKIVQEQMRELFNLEGKETKHREVVYEQINTYIKETVTSCPLDAQYLLMWDSATEPSDAFLSTVSPVDSTGSTEKGKAAS